MAAKVSRYTSTSGIIEDRNVPSGHVPLWQRQTEILLTLNGSEPSGRVTMRAFYMLDLLPVYFL